MRVIGPDDVQRHLNFRTCIDLMRDAAVAVSEGGCVLPLRWGMALPDNRGMMGMMPGYLSQPPCFGIKVVNLLPRSAAHGMSSHTGSVLLFNATDGRPLAVIDGGALTAIRTAAASAMATDILSRVDATALGMLGSGEQALAHVEAMLEIRPFSRVFIWSRTEDHAESFANKIESTLKVNATAVASVEHAVEEVDVICSVTGARDVILEGRYLKPGQHVIAAGASMPDAREIDVDVVTCGKYVVDYRDYATSLAGELQPSYQDTGSPANLIYGEIGQIISGQLPGRVAEDEITVYRSLGNAAQDLIVAEYLYRQIEEST